MSKRFGFWFVSLLIVVALLPGITLMMGCAPANKAISEASPATGLTSGGAAQQGIEVHGHWAIELIGSAFSSRTPLGDIGAIIVESPYPGTGPSVFRTLTLTAPGISDVTSQPLRLTGTAIAERDGGITQVKTVLSKLTATEVSSNHYGSSVPFTTANLESAVALTAGQSITATVVITFSGPSS